MQNSVYSMRAGNENLHSCLLHLFKEIGWRIKKQITMVRSMGRGQMGDREGGGCAFLSFYILNHVLPDIFPRENVN